jgi:nitrite reductase (NO-forming)
MGQVFDRVHVGGAGEPLQQVQTTLVPPGGAVMTEFALKYPGHYMLVDHALGRIDKGAIGMLHVTGPENPEIMQLVRKDPGTIVEEHDEHETAHGSDHDDEEEEEEDED